MINNKEVVLINIREGQQTAGCKVDTILDLSNPNLPPPPSINNPAVESLISQLPQYPDLLVELYNPISGPTAAHNLRDLLTLAQKHHVKDRVGVHIRLARNDLMLATQSGATRIHIFESPNRRDFGEIKIMTSQSIDFISQNFGADNIPLVRTSIEHASQTSPETVTEYVQQVLDINHGHKKQIIVALGLPDTNGIATPEIYQALLKQLDKVDSNHTLYLHTHLHNDNGRALENLELIRDFCAKHGIKVCIEAVLPKYPGERNGIKPTLDYFSPNDIPAIAYNVISGSSWLDQESSLSYTPKVNTAGVHSSSPQLYPNEGLPHPGIYGIMGKANISYAFMVLFTQTEFQNLPGSTAQVARELAAQKGNLNQAALFAIARLALTKPAFIDQFARSFGEPKDWLDQPPPDLSPLLDQLPSGIVN